MLDTTSDDKELLRSVTKNWIDVSDQSGGNYNVNKETRIKTPMFRSDLCDYSDACIVAKGTITVTDPDNAKSWRWLLKIMHHLLIAFTMIQCTVYSANVQFP